MQVEAVTPRVRAWPIVGSAVSYLRDPLGFFEGAAKLGPIVELALPPVKSFQFSDPEDIEYVLVTAYKGMSKDIALQDLKHALGNGLLTSEGESWRRQRRIAQPAFHRDRIRKYAEQMVSTAEAVASTFREGEARNLHADLMRTTLEIVTRCLFGAELDEPDAKAILAAMAAVTERFDGPLSLIPGVTRLPLPQFRRFKTAMQGFDRVIMNLIARERARGTTDGTNLLSMLLAAKTETGGPLDDVWVRDEVATMVLAGHDTTANVLAWTFALLGRHPRVDAKLHAEVDAVLGERSPSLDDLPNLPYTEQVVNEALRLYPPAWGFGRAVLEPFERRGISFPKGTQIYMCPWVVHRNATYFPEPLAFRPERWADGFVRTLPKYAFLPFGGGPRVCIGNAFAMTEATLVLATWAKRFRFDPASNRPVVPRVSLTLGPRHGVVVRPRRR
ncbi:MAG TPA: cytochrome P450 [Polyangiaceae bacterium]|nr:cytochrome P450 [Polyangiaceae bacterium]